MLNPLEGTSWSWTQSGPRLDARVGRAAEVWQTQRPGSSGKAMGAGSVPVQIATQTQVRGNVCLESILLNLQGLGPQGPL